MEDDTKAGEPPADAAAGEDTGTGRSARRAKRQRVEIAPPLVDVVNAGDRTIDRSGIEVDSAREAKALVEAAGHDERGRSLLRSVPID